MKKAVWVLNIDNYRPDITKYTLPTIKAYAEKIGAEYHEITERKFPDFPITYEKMQLWELGKDYDWNILIDADVLISDKMQDVIAVAKEYPKTVISLQQCNAVNYFKPGPNFNKLRSIDLNDGTKLVPTTSANFVITNKATHVIYEPVELSPEEMAQQTVLPYMCDEYNFLSKRAEYGIDSRRLIDVGVDDSLIHHLAATTDNNETESDIINKLEEFKKPIKYAVLVASTSKIQKMCDLTYPTIRAYAEKIGADFVHKEISNPSLARLEIANLLDEYSRVLYVDSDVIIRPDSPNIFDTVPQEKMGLLDEGRFTSQILGLYKMYDQANVPPDKRAKKYWGFGVAVVSRGHKHLFQDMDPRMKDTDHLNMVLHAFETPIKEISYKFNFQHFLGKFCGEERHSAYFIHYSGGLKNVGVSGLVNMIKDDLTIWEQAAPEYNFKRNINIIVGGGLGDQITAEPTARYVKNVLYKDANIVISTAFPELFLHLGVPVYTHNSPLKPNKIYYEMETYKGLDSPIWQVVSHTLSNATDYAAISALRLQLPLDHRHITLPHSEKDKSKVLSILGGADIDKTVVMHCGKGWKSKTLPKEIWQSYIDALIDAGYTVILIGKTVNEAQGAVEVDSSRCINTVDKLSIQQTIELIRMCKVLISNDSSPVHMAGASDCWIGLIATCKHPDYILPYRNGSTKYKTINLERNAMYYDYDWRPTSVDTASIEGCTDQRLVECAPTAEGILDFVNKSLTK
jgi:alpha-N-acetylglucosamine transferase